MKVLTINLSVLMHQCIRLYQHYIDLRENSTVIWEQLEKNLGLEKFLSVDSKMIFSIISALKALKSQDVPIAFVDSTDKIPALLSTHFGDEKIDLANVDYFHGIYYGNPQKLFDFGEFDRKSWVGYLLANKRLSSYTWGYLPTTEEFHAYEGDKSFKDCSFDVTPCFEILKGVHSTDANLDLVVISNDDKYIPYKFHVIWEMLNVFFNENLEDEVTSDERSVCGE